MNEMFKIGDREIGSGCPCYVIAEAGVNHNGDLDVGFALIDAAKRAGADAVKFQQFLTDEIVTAGTSKAGYQRETTGVCGGQREMLRALELNEGQQAELKARCDDVGITYICTPYDWPSVDLLDRMDVAAYKVASTDATNTPFLRYLSSKRRPIILSTGMCDLAEIRHSVATLRRYGSQGNFMLLHCVSAYPAPVAEMNLRAIGALASEFECPVGFSDHSRGIVASPLAVATGACLVEKHLTLDRNMDGPDHRASMEPSEMARLIDKIREVEEMLGDGNKRVMPSEQSNKLVMQRSLVVQRDIAAGEVISARDIGIKRPGGGLVPADFDRVVGRTAALTIAADTILTEDSVVWDD